MELIKKRIENIQWTNVSEEMHSKGFAQIPALLTTQECVDLISNYDVSSFYRKTISMERYRFGAGEYKYFNYPLPDLVQNIRELVYPKLAVIANQWMKALNETTRFPSSLLELHDLCRKQNQDKSTVLILKYGVGGHNTLHQDLYGEIFFPMQLVLFLNDPTEEYEGGEFVLVEQRPRAQSKAIVLKPKRGDMLLFTTNFRPVQGSRGYYRVNMRHGVAEVRSGQRHTLGIIFHDAQ